MSQIDQLAKLEQTKRVWNASRSAHILNLGILTPRKFRASMLSPILKKCENTLGYHTIQTEPKYIHHSDGAIP